MAVGERVEKVYNQILVPAGMGDVAIYTELGRFMISEPWPNYATPSPLCMPGR